jgi:phytoene dehydrogenase-like protein
VGGSGALTDATRRSFEAAGGRTRCDSTVERLLVEDGAAVGVRLVDGTSLRSGMIVAACDPRRVFVDWLDGVPTKARDLIDDWRRRPVSDGYESKIDAVLTGLPEWQGTSDLAGLVGGADLLGPTTLISPSPEQIAEAARLREDGRVHPLPSMMVNVPSVLDPDMQPEPDQHVLSLEVLWTPYDLEGGWPGSDQPARWLDVLAGFMDDSLAVDRYRAMTPDRYEAEFQMHRGHTPSYAGPPLVAFLGRNRETTRYRCPPIDGLYLSGAGTFPGAGVFGASGRNAADAVLHDLRDEGVLTTARRKLAGVRT